MAKPLLDFSHLTPDERIDLAEALWNSLATTPESVSLTVAQEEELDRRLEDYRRDRNPGTPWREALRRIAEPGACRLFPRQARSTAMAQPALSSPPPVQEP